MLGTAGFQLFPLLPLLSPLVPERPFAVLRRGQGGGTAGYLINKFPRMETPSGCLDSQSLLWYLSLALSFLVSRH